MKPPLSGVSTHTLRLRAGARPDAAAARQPLHTSCA